MVNLLSLSPTPRNVIPAKAGIQAAERNGKHLVELALDVEEKHIRWI